MEPSSARQASFASHSLAFFYLLAHPHPHPSPSFPTLFSIGGCVNGPCSLRGSTCIATGLEVDQFVCSCPNGEISQSCTPISPCASFRCRPPSFCLVDSHDQPSCSAVFDIDECSLDNRLCHADATCSNTWGSYTCTCNSGFFGNGTICTRKRFSSLPFVLFKSLFLTETFFLSFFFLLLLLHQRWEMETMEMTITIIPQFLI